MISDGRYVTLRTLVQGMDHDALDISADEALTLATTYATQLGYQGAEGGQSPHMEVTTDHAAVIVDLITDTDESGVYRGDLSRVSRIARGNVTGIGPHAPEGWHPERREESPAPPRDGGKHRKS